MDDDELQRLSEELRRPVDRKDALVIKSFAAVRNLVWKSGGANVDIQPLGRDCKGKAIVIKSTGERIVHQCNAPMAIENGDAVTGVYFAGDGVVGYRLRFGTNCFRCQQWHSAQVSFPPRETRVMLILPQRRLNVSPEKSPRSEILISCCRKRLSIYSSLSPTVSWVVQQFSTDRK